MSNGFLTWGAWEGREIGHSEEGLAYLFEQPEPPAPDRRIVHHDHDRLEESVDRRAEPQKVA
jgi:hypothetical protein